MKGKWGALMVDGRGKLGGHVLTKNRQGAAMRTKSTPVNRRSNSQSGARNRFTTSSQAWSGLTASERAQWNAAGADFKKTNIFGDSYNPTGKNLYAILNNNLALVGQGPITEPPAPQSVPALTALAVASATTAALTVSFAPTPMPADHRLVIFATRGLSAGTGFVKNQFKYISNVAPAGATPANIFAAYSAIYGAPVAGKYITVKAFILNETTGQRGIPLQATLVVS